MAEIINPVFTEKTTPTKPQIVVGNLDKQRIELYKTVKPMHDKEYDRFWNNKNATPQEICDSAKDPYKFFEISTKTQELLALLNPYIDENNPGYIPKGVPEGCDVSIDSETGKMIITDNRVKIPEGDGANPQFAGPVAPVVSEVVPEVVEPNPQPEVEEVAQ